MRGKEITQVVFDELAETIGGPKPEKSTVIFKLVEGDSKFADGVEVGEFAGRGGSWELEGLTSTQLGAIEDMLWNMPTETVFSLGWWIIHGFYVRFTEDETLEGKEYDADYESDEIRPATEAELEQFGVSDIFYDRHSEAGVF